MLKKPTPLFIAFLQATGLFVYIMTLVAFMSKLSNYFSDDVVQMFAPVIMLLLFVLSAVVCSTMFLGYSGVLFWNKKYKESFTLIGLTVGWGFFYFFSIVGLFLWISTQYSGI